MEVDVTVPRQRLPGTTYLVTRACERREFRLKPSAETNAAFAVAMVEAATRHGVEVIAVCQMSSHYHAVVFDRAGRLSEFLRDFHAVMGRFGSARDGVEGCAFWDGDQTDEVVLGDLATVIEKVAYVLANPVKDHVVEDVEMWPGVRTRVDELGTGMGRVYRRPKRFFAADGWVSEDVMVPSEYPVEFADLVPVEVFRREVQRRVERMARAAREEVARGEARWRGLAEMRRLSVWHSDARLRGAESGPKRRRRVAAATRGRARAMLEALRAFLKAHREAWEAFRRGAYEREFPAGTWFAWRFYGARRGEGSGVFREAPT